MEIPMTTKAKTKLCIKCGEVKGVEGFYREKRNLDGLGSYCKSCARRTSREWRKKNPERYRQYLKKWLDAHPDYRREYYKKNSKKYRRISKRWNTENPQKYRAKYIAQHAYERGELKKPKRCQKCNKIKRLDRHHPNYAFPLRIEWLCRVCHKEKHRSLAS
jgi:hypothetical protein